MYPSGSFYWAPEQVPSLLVLTKMPAMTLMLAAASLAELATFEAANQ